MVTLHPVTRQVEPQTQRSSLRSEQAALTRSRIVGGAKAVFEARGYEGARIEDIASKAGVAVPTVYSYSDTFAFVMSRVPSIMRCQRPSRHHLQ